MKTWHKVLVVACGMAAATAPARAQYTNPYTGTTWNNPMSSYLDTVIMGNQQMSNLIIQQSINRSILKRSIARSHGKSKTRSAQRSARRSSKHNSKTAVKHSRPTTHAAPVAAPVAAQAPAPAANEFQNAVRATNFKFTASPVVPQKMAQLLIPKAEDRPKAAKIFGWCLQSAREDFRKNPRANLPADNVARALAFFLISSHGLAVTRNGEKIGQRFPITQEQADALRRQIALALSRDAGFLAKSNREKQEMYEMLLIMPAYAETVYGIGLQKNNTEAQELARGLARDSLQKLIGIKPEKMRFTEVGLQF